MKVCLLFLGGQRAGPGDVRVETVCALEREHPSGIFEWQGAGFVELLELLGCQFEVGCGDVVGKLVRAFGTDDDGGDDWLCEQPCE